MNYPADINFSIDPLAHGRDARRIRIPVWLFLVTAGALTAASFSVLGYACYRAGLLIF